jgi:hypothetical protein
MLALRSFDLKRYQREKYKGEYMPVPYVFDYPGFVNTYYAVPDDNIDIKSVRERYCLGPCREDEAFLAAIEIINQFKEEKLKLIGEFDYLDPKNKKDALFYIEEHFKLAAAHQALIYSLQKTCI